MSSKEFGVGATIPEVQRRVVLRGDIVKDDSEPMQYLAMKIPAAKAAVNKEWEKTGENFGVELDKSQK